jgi:hypothetical protein
VVERSADGGIRIDGGAGGFAERTVSLKDIAWALVASDDVFRSGGILDEQRLNRLRYIDGPPKGSTRWIDSGWALLLVRAAEAQRNLLDVSRRFGSARGAWWSSKRLGSA